MKREIIKEFDMLGDALSTLNAQFAYRLMNLCVKAEPVSLLSIEAMIEGESQKLEECSQIGQEDDYSFQVYPNYDGDIPALAQAIFKDHPEFKQEFKTMQVDVSTEEGKSDMQDVHYINVTMPEVEKAFKEHMGWLPELPSPYFVKAGQGIIDRFKDCTVRGVTISAPGFYGPQGRIVRMPLAMPDMLEKIESFRFDGDWRITNFEMESAPVAGFARHLGHDAATVCCAIANRYLKSSNPDYKQQVRGLVELALDRMTR